MRTKVVKSFPIVILGGGVVAGYAVEEFAAQSGKKGDLAIVTAENALPNERSPRSKGFAAGTVEPSHLKISAADFYRMQGIAVCSNFLVQIQADPFTMTVEDPTIPWDEADALCIKVGTILIPIQKYESKEQMEFGENLSFTPLAFGGRSSPAWRY